jgi:hypothetical protein
VTAVERPRRRYTEGDMAKKKPAPENPWPGKLRRLKALLGKEDNRALAKELGVSFDTLRGWLYRGQVPSTIARKHIDLLLKVHSD